MTEKNTSIEGNEKVFCFDYSNIKGMQMVNKYMKNTQFSFFPIFF